MEKQAIVREEETEEQIKQRVVLEGKVERNKIINDLQNELSMSQSGINVLKIKLLETEMQQETLKQKYETDMNALETKLIEKENMEGNLKQHYETDLNVLKSKYEIQITDYTLKLQEKEKVLSKLQLEHKLVKDAYVTTNNSKKKMLSEFLGLKDSNKYLTDEKERLEVELKQVTSQLNNRENKLNSVKAEIEHLTLLQLAAERDKEEIKYDEDKYER